MTTWGLNEKIRPSQWVNAGLKVRTFSSPDRNTLYGNTQSNRMECEANKEDCLAYGAGGEDMFTLKIQPNSLYIKDFKENQNDGDKIVIPRGYADVKAIKGAPGKIVIEASYESSDMRGDTVRWLKVVLEDTKWSLEEVERWAETAKNSTKNENRENPISNY